MPKTFVKITWYEPNNMQHHAQTSLIVVRGLSKIIFLTGSMFSSVVEVNINRTIIVIDIFSVFLKPFILRIFVLLMVDSPNVIVNISNVLAHSIQFFIQKAIEDNLNTTWKWFRGTYPGAIFISHNVVAVV